MRQVCDQLLDTLEANAAAAGGEDGTDGAGWSVTHGPGEPARVWSADDDAEPVATIGGYVDPADAVAAAQHIASADPPTVLALVAEIRRLRHRQADTDLANEAIRWKRRALDTERCVNDLLDATDVRGDGEASVRVADVRAALNHEGRL